MARLELPGIERCPYSSWGRATSSPSPTEGNARALPTRRPTQGEPMSSESRPTGPAQERAPGAPEAHAVERTGPYRTPDVVPSEAAPEADGGPAPPCIPGYDVEGLIGH